MSQTTANKTCDGCGREITPQQIMARQAGLVGGVLLCPGCVAKKREELRQAHAATGAPPDTSHDADGIDSHAVYIPPEPKHDEESPLSLVDDGATASSGENKIRSFATGGIGSHTDVKFSRPLAGHDQPATRCRTFHGKLTEPGLAHMDEQINEWLDAHPEVFIKSATTSVGVFEGKTKEPHLLMTVFY